MKKLIIFLVLSLWLAASCVALTPRTERTDAFEAGVSVVVSEKDNGIEYHYIFKYAASNKRDFSSLSFNFSKDITRNEFLTFSGTAPRNINWKGMLSEAIDYKPLRLRPTGKRTIKVTRVSPNMALEEDPFNLKPGETLNVFILTKGTETMPGLVDMEGYCTQANWVFEDAGEAPPDYDDGFHPKIFRVIGPTPKPRSVSGIMDKLIEFTEEAYRTQLITSQDVYQGLMDKLIAAKAKIAAGASSYHTAKNILGAFTNQMKAQRGKAIKEECYQMLKIEAEMVIAAL